MAERGQRERRTRHPRRWPLLIATPFVSALGVIGVIGASPAAAATAGTVPSAPREVTSVAGENSVTVNFLAPASDGGARITRYSIEVFPTHARGAVARECAATRCVLHGLAPDTTYYFRVAALNRFGAGPYSGVSNKVRPRAPRPTSVKVTFDANGGSGTMALESEPYARSSPLNANAFTYLGYTFAGWNTSPAGDGIGYANGQAVTLTANVTLYAQWTAQTVSITFDANGGTGTMALESEPYGTSVPLSANAFTNPGDTFAGWSTSPGGGGASFGNGQIVRFTVSLTLYAQWSSGYQGSTSTNWSGYVVPASSVVTSASGAWTVPILNCVATPNASSATWVGTGGALASSGASSGDLLQTGVEDDCVNGAQVDQAWWEMVPNVPNVEQPFSSFPVSPGDSMSAQVYQEPSGQWATVLQDTTTGLQGVMITGDAWFVSEISTNVVVGATQGSTAAMTYAGGSSAEWIVEVPTNGADGSLMPFANFGAITFSNVETSLAGWALALGDQWEIVQNGVVLAAPSAANGAVFTVTYQGG